MNDRVKFIVHKDIEILSIDWTNATADEVLKAMEDVKRVIALRPLRSVRTLTNANGARLDKRVTAELKDYAAHNKPFVLAGAVVGLNDLKMVAFNFVNRATGRSLRAMSSIEEAKDWLAATVAD
jgi:hypothetical protein